MKRTRSATFPEDAALRLARDRLLLDRPFLFPLALPLVVAAVAP